MISNQNFKVTLAFLTKKYQISQKNPFFTYLILITLKSDVLAIFGLQHRFQYQKNLQETRSPIQTNLKSCVFIN